MKKLVLCFLIVFSAASAMEQPITSQVYYKLVVLKFLKYGVGTAMLVAILCPWTCYPCEIDSVQVCCCGDWGI